MMQSSQYFGGQFFGNQGNSGGQSFGNQGNPGVQPFGNQGNPGGQTFGNQGNPDGQPFGNRGNSGGQSFGNQGNPGGQPFGNRGNSGGQSFGNQGNPGGQTFGNRGNSGGQSFGNQGNPGGQTFGNRGNSGGQPFGNRGNDNVRPFGNRGNDDDRPFGNRGKDDDGPFGNQGNHDDQPYGNQRNFGSQKHDNQVDWSGNRGNKWQLGQETGQKLWPWQRDNRDSGSSLTPQSSNPPPGPEQEAGNATRGNLDSWKSPGMSQAPGKNPRGPIEGRHGNLYCEVCNLTFPNKGSLNRHRIGSAHYTQVMKRHDQDEHRRQEMQKIKSTSTNAVLDEKSPHPADRKPGRHIVPEGVPKFPHEIPDPHSGPQGGSQRQPHGRSLSGPATAGGNFNRAEHNENNPQRTNWGNQGQGNAQRNRFDKSNQNNRGNQRQGNAQTTNNQNNSQRTNWGNRGQGGAQNTNRFNKGNQNNPQRPNWGNQQRGDAQRTNKFGQNNSENNNPNKGYNRPEKRKFPSASDAIPPKEARYFPLPGQSVTDPRNPNRPHETPQLMELTFGQQELQSDNRAGWQESGGQGQPRPGAPGGQGQTQPSPGGRGQTQVHKRDIMEESRLKNLKTNGCQICSIDKFRDSAAECNHRRSRVHKDHLREYIALLGWEYAKNTYKIVLPLELSLQTLREEAESIRAGLILPRDFSPHELIMYFEFILEGAKNQDSYCVICQKDFSRGDQNWLNYIQHMLSKEHSWTYAEVARKLDNQVKFTKLYSHVPGPLKEYLSETDWQWIPATLWPKVQPRHHSPRPQDTFSALTKQQIKEIAYLVGLKADVQNEAIPPWERAKQGSGALQPQTSAPVSSAPAQPMAGAFQPGPGKWPTAGPRFPQPQTTFAPQPSTSNFTGKSAQLLKSEMFKLLKNLQKVNNPMATESSKPMSLQPHAGHRDSIQRNDSVGYDKKRQLDISDTPSMKSPEEAEEDPDLALMQAIMDTIDGDDNEADNTVYGMEANNMKGKNVQNQVQACGQELATLLTDAMKEIKCNMYISEKKKGQETKGSARRHSIDSRGRSRTDSVRSKISPERSYRFIDHRSKDGKQEHESSRKSPERKSRSVDRRSKERTRDNPSPGRRKRDQSENIEPRTTRQPHKESTYSKRRDESRDRPRSRGSSHLGERPGETRMNDPPPNLFPNQEPDFLQALVPVISEIKEMLGISDYNEIIKLAEQLSDFDPEQITVDKLPGLINQLRGDVDHRPDIVHEHGDVDLRLPVESLMAVEDEGGCPPPGMDLDRYREEHSELNAREMPSYEPPSFHDAPFPQESKDSDLRHHDPFPQEGKDSDLRHHDPFPQEGNDLDLRHHDLFPQEGNDLDLRHHPPPRHSPGNTRGHDIPGHFHEDHDMRARPSVGHSQERDRSNFGVTRISRNNSPSQFMPGTRDQSSPDDFRKNDKRGRSSHGRNSNAANRNPENHDNRQSPDRFQNRRRPTPDDHKFAGRHRSRDNAPGFRDQPSAHRFPDDRRSSDRARSSHREHFHAGDRIPSPEHFPNRRANERHRSPNRPPHPQERVEMSRGDERYNRPGRWSPHPEERAEMGRDGQHNRPGRWSPHPEEMEEVGREDERHPHRPGRWSPHPEERAEMGREDERHPHRPGRWSPHPEERAEMGREDERHPHRPGRWSPHPEERAEMGREDERHPHRPGRWSPHPEERPKMGREDERLPHRPGRPHPEERSEMGRDEQHNRPGRWSPHPEEMEEVGKEDEQHNRPGRWSPHPKDRAEMGREDERHPHRPGRPHPEDRAEMGREDERHPHRPGRWSPHPEERAATGREDERYNRPGRWSPHPEERAEMSRVDDRRRDPERRSRHGSRGKHNSHNLPEMEDLRDHRPSPHDIAGRHPSHRGPHGRHRSPSPHHRRTPPLAVLDSLPPDLLEACAGILEHPVIPELLEMLAGGDQGQLVALLEGLQALDPQELDLIVEGLQANSDKQEEILHRLQSLFA